DELDRGRAGVGERVHERDLLVGGEHHLLELEALARADFADVDVLRDVAHGLGSCDGSDTALAATSDSISAADIPASPSTSRVCSPSFGGERRTVNSYALLENGSFGSLPMRPSCIGTGSSCPVSFRCGSSSSSSGRLTGA